jgi:hypothetical protein
VQDFAKNEKFKKSTKSKLPEAVAKKRQQIKLK